MPKPKKKQPKAKTLEELQVEWYAKIKDADPTWRDIERDENTLKEYSTSRRNSAHMTVLNWQANAQYYQMASDFLNDYRFDNAFEKTVWMYHSEGLSKYEISRIFRKLNPKKRGYGTDKMYLVVVRLRKSMFAMYLLPQVEYRE